MYPQPDTLASAVVRVEIFFSAERLQPLRHDRQPAAKAAGFETELKEYLEGFVADLGLRTSINLKVEWLEANAIEGGPPLRVFINEQRCRMPLLWRAPENINHRQLAFHVADIVRQNSATLIPASLSDTLRKDWSTGPEPHLALLDSKSFNSLLVALVRRGHSVERARRVRTPFADSTAPGPVSAVIEEALQSGAQPPLRILLPMDLINAPGEKCQALRKEVQDSIFFGMGMQLPPIEVVFDLRVYENEFCVQVNDLRHPPVDGPYPAELFVDLPADELARLELKDRVGLHPVLGAQGTIVAGSPEQIKKLSDAGHKLLDYWDLLAKGVKTEVHRSAGSLLTTAILKLRIGALEGHSPNLVSLVSSRFPVSQLAQIMRELLDETISIRDIRSLFEALVSLNGTTSTDPTYDGLSPYTANFMPVENGARLEDLTTSDYSNWLRISLRQSISQKFTPKDNQLSVFLLTPESETKLRRVDDEPLTSEESESLHKAILNQLDLFPGRNDFIILTTPGVRKKLQELIKIEFPWLVVLCRNELSPDLIIQSVASIGVAQELLLNSANTSESGSNS